MIWPVSTFKRSRQYCLVCKKDRPHVDGNCVVCTEKANQMLEAQRLSDLAFFNLNPEE